CAGYCWPSWRPRRRGARRLGGRGEVEAGRDGPDRVVKAGQERPAAAAAVAADPVPAGQAERGDCELGQDVQPQVVASYWPDTGKLNRLRF
ncbi:MAG TPA: hypothetical protein VGR98_18300, partial [Streptosporangiaceae bacterium]|nr:hypothetical protein [Streptosporangiaceae bacterium]